MPSSIPHQKFCFYHLPTRGRAGIKFGEAWYVSNISIIFYCSMLLYYLFWMFMGFTLRFYIIFGTNLQTGGPAQTVVFFPISVFHRKGISNGVQPEWNLRERDFWNKRNPGDLELNAGKLQGGHEAGGVSPWARPPPSWPPRLLLDFHYKSFGSRLFQKSRSRRFHSVGLRLIFLFFETLK